MTFVCAHQTSRLALRRLSPEPDSSSLRRSNAAVASKLKEAGLRSTDKVHAGRRFRSLPVNTAEPASNGLCGDRSAGETYRAEAPLPAAPVDNRIAMSAEVPLLHAERIT